MNDEPPIFPAHIENAVRRIAELHAEHYRSISPVQRVVERTTELAGTPKFVLAITAAVVMWIAINIGLSRMGHVPFDPPPFYWLQGLITLAALYMTIIILTTQRRENRLIESRAQLTLQIAIISEQKIGKVIELLEKLRRDSPDVADRVDTEAREMIRPVDPEAILDANKEQLAAAENVSSGGE